MSGTVNKVILIGNLGKDPEIRVLENRTKVARFQVATSESYRDKSSGKRITNTEWHSVVAWRELADIVDNYLSKGQKVYVEGKLRNRSWTAQDGTEKHQVDIYADVITILSSKQAKERPIQNPNFNTDDTPDKPQPLPEELIIKDEDILPF